MLLGGGDGTSAAGQEAAHLSMLQVYAEVTGVSPNRGSVVGGTTLILTGMAMVFGRPSLSKHHLLIPDTI